MLSECTSTPLSPIPSARTPVGGVTEATIVPNRPSRLETLFLLLFVIIRRLIAFAQSIHTEGWSQLLRASGFTRALWIVNLMGALTTGCEHTLRGKDVMWVLFAP